MIKPKQFQTKLLKWYDQAGRHDLPWQLNKTPYRVWVSEVMLQQTQVTTVIPYYNKFIKRFPTVKSLALAPQDEVFHYWSGLGFYTRARNLHKTAIIVHSELNGRFPKTVEQLEELPGIGRSTAGAILSLASNLSAPILDGNVKRVFTRVFTVEGYPEASQPKKQLWAIAQELMPSTRCDAYNQALMDLGASLCSKTNPSCSRCPFETICQAHQTDTTHLFPFKKPKKKIPKKEVYFHIFRNSDNEILLEKRQLNGIWGGLWSFPESDHAKTTKYSNRFNLNLQKSITLPSFKHVFTHFELTIHPVIIPASAKTNLVMESQQQVWYNPKQALPGGIPRPVEKIIKQIFQ